MSEAPCTLFWPRTGIIAAPQRPIIPVARIKLSMAVTMSWPVRCWVSPIAQRVVVLGPLA